MSARIILYGSGKIGRNALCFFGNENVECFCDSNISISGTEVSGKKVISLKELNEIRDKYILIISAGANYTDEISKALEAYGIYGYLFYEDVKEIILTKLTMEQFLENYSTPEKILHIQKDYYREKAKEILEQFEQLKEQADIMDFKPDMEYVRKKQAWSVEFYLVDAFEIDHFAPLYSFFRKKGMYAVFVVEDTDENTSGKWFDYEKAIERLEEKKLSYKRKCNPNARFAFSTQAAHILRKYSKKTVRINIMYGCALNRNSWGLAKGDMDGFDYRFVYGEYGQDICKLNMGEDKVRIMGYIRRHEETAYEKIKLQEELSVHTQKPVLVYFPTWDDDSSVSMYYESFLELRKDYFIITKIHHCTYRLGSKKRDKELIYEFSDIVLEPFYSFKKASFIGDAVMVDAKSGAALELSLINPDVKMLWLSVREDMKSYFFEQVFDMAEIINKPWQLRESIEKVLENDKYLGRRQELLTYFFGEKDVNYLENIYEELFHKTLEDDKNGSDFDSTACL